MDDVSYALTDKRNSYPTCNTETHAHTNQLRVAAGAMLLAYDEV